MPDLTPPVEQPVTVSANPVPPIALTLLRYGLTAIGGVMASKGLIDEGAIEQIVGALLVLISAVWGAVLTKRDNAVKVTLADKLPDSVARVK